MEADTLGVAETDGVTVTDALGKADDSVSQKWKQSNIAEIQDLAEIDHVALARSSSGCGFRR